MIAAALLASSCGGGSSGSPGNNPAIPPGGVVDGVAVGVPDIPGGTAAGVMLTPQTVIVDRATVAANLLHVSGDGTYTFASAAGALTSLAPGKVMLLEGTDAAHVTAIENSGGQLVVHTSPVTIPEVIHSGQFHYKGPIDFTNAMVAPVIDAEPAPSPSATTSSVRLLSAGVTTATLEHPSPRLLDASTGLFIQGPLKDGSNFNYRAGIFGDTNGLNFQATLCYLVTVEGTTCSNASQGLTASMTVTARLKFGDANLDMSVINGHVAEGGFSTSWTNGGFKVEYAFGQGEAVQGIFFPVLRIPLAWDIPWPISGIPMMLKFRMAAILKLGLSSKNDTVKGGVDFSMTGQAGVSQSGSGVSGVPGTGGAAHGQVLGSTRSAPSGAPKLPTVRGALCDTNSVSCRSGSNRRHDGERAGESTERRQESRG